MARYHLNPTTGSAGLCKATVSCPFGDLESDHFPSKEEASRHYEKRQERLLAAKEKFSTSMPRLMGLLEEKASGYYVPGALVNARHSLEVSTWINKTFKNILSPVMKRELTEEEVAVYSREASGELLGRSLSEPKTWRAYFDRLTQEALENNTSKTHPLKASTAHHFKEEMGSPTQAKELIKLLKNYPQDNLIETVTDANFKQKLKAKGFSTVGYGAEQVVFCHDETNTIWKTPNWKDSDHEAYVKNALIGQETFPEDATMRHATTSGYFYDGFGVIAQERVALETTVRYEKDQWVRLQLAGHNDLPHNSAFDTEGRLVAFDTLGEVWDDVDCYRLQS